MVSICGAALYETSLASTLVLVKTAAVIKASNAPRRRVAAALSLLNVLVVFMIISFVGCGVGFWLVVCFVADGVTLSVNKLTRYRAATNW